MNQLTLVLSRSGHVFTHHPQKGGTFSQNCQGVEVYLLGDCFGCIYKIHGFVFCRFELFPGIDPCLGTAPL